GLVPGQIVTDSLVEEPTVRGGEAVADPARDLAKIAVIERHLGTGRTGLGFVRGFGLQRGAIASTVAHDAHNVVVVGMSDSAVAGPCSSRTAGPGRWTMPAASTRAAGCRSRRG